MPTRDTAWPAGTPCWVDYSASDLDAAQAFYTDLLGWTYTEGQPEFGGYLNCLAKDRMAAGMAPKMDPSQPSVWTTYFATDDAEATTAAVTSAGGTVVTPPMDVGPLGRMAVALDTQGHVFGYWQAGEHTGAQIYNEPGALIWNEEAVADPDAARDFYRSVFGFTYEEMPGADGYTTFATGGDPLGGLGSHQEGKPVGWAVCFAVNSADDAVATVERAGGTVITAAQDSPYGRFAVVSDPWGAPFSIVESAS